MASAYDLWAQTYDAQINQTRDLDAAILRSHGPSIRGRSVLELGCGTGKNTDWLAAQCRQVTALDFSPGMLAIARSRITASHVQFMQHDLLEPWPVESGAIDLVIGNLVLEHVADVRPIFAEAVRVLRRGGKLFLSEQHPVRQLRGAQAHFVDESSGSEVRVPAFRHSISEFVNAAIGAGFALRSMGEWIEDGEAADAAPRLLTLQFVRAT